MIERYIYAIVASDTYEALWVGATTQPRKRLRDHRRKPYGRAVINRGASIRILHLETCIGGAWIEAEQDWIRRLRDAGAPLQNRAIGGYSATGYTFTTEQRERAHFNRLGRPMRPEHKARLLAIHTGAKRSTEYRAKLSEVRKGKPLSPAVLATRFGRVHSEETKAKMSAARTKWYETKRAREESTGWTEARREAYERRKR